MTKINRPPSRQPIPENAKKVFEGRIFDVYQWEQKMFDGTTSTFEKLKRVDTVAIIPITDEGKIIITEQEQPGIYPFVGVLGGMVDPGEDIIEAAKRELLEESGYEASEFVLWTSEQFMSKIDWAIYTFIAKGIKKVDEQKLEAGERIRLKEVAFDEFINIASNRKFRDFEISLEIFREQAKDKDLNHLKGLFSAR